MSRFSSPFSPNIPVLFPVFIVQQHHGLHHVSEHHHCHSQHGWVTQTTRRLLCLGRSAWLTRLSTDREVQLLGHQYCGSEQRERGRGDLHRLHNEGRSRGCRRTHRAWRHAAAGQGFNQRVVGNLKPFYVQQECYVVFFLRWTTLTSRTWAMTMQCAFSETSCTSQGELHLRQKLYFLCTQMKLCNSIFHSRPITLTVAKCWDPNPRSCFALPRSELEPFFFPNWNSSIDNISYVTFLWQVSRSGLSTQQRGFPTRLPWLGCTLHMAWALLWAPSPPPAPPLAAPFPKLSVSDIDPSPLGLAVLDPDSFKLLIIYIFGCWMSDSAERWQKPFPCFKSSSTLSKHSIEYFLLLCWSSQAPSAQ